MPPSLADSTDVAAGTAGVLAAQLLAVDARGLGGALLDHPDHEAARLFAHAVHTWLPQGAPLRRVPAGVTADRLYGGVDLAATLATRRVVAERGVLAAADGGLLVVPMAERLDVSARTALCAALDRAEVPLARDGLTELHAARVCVVLFDESCDDEVVHDALRDRVAFMPTLDADAYDALGALSDGAAHERMRRRIRDARHRLPSVSVDDAWAAVLATTAALFGVDSVRALLMALRAARAIAAFEERLVVTESDVERAAALVLAPRATRLPPPDAHDEPPPPPTDGAEQAAASPPPPPPSSDTSESDRSDAPAPSDGAGELLREAVTAALPPGLLAQLLAQGQHGGASGRKGAEDVNLLRGRPRGARSGAPRGGARLHLLETLRAAAPWQRARATPVVSARMSAPVAAPRVAIRREDFRVRRFIERTGTTVLFVVDASGSSAVQRLGEAKGAVELLLAESYARRDKVSLLAFRGQGTEVLLPPTRALARARRALAALPGGGGTPLAHALETVVTQALAVRRSGSAPLVVLLSDGRANIARDGTPGRAQAERDALVAARGLAALQLPALFVDTSPRGELVARRVAEAMRARYVPLPTFDARALGGLVRAASEAAR